MSRVDFMPSPVVSPSNVNAETPNEHSFEMQPLPHGENNFFEAAANGRLAEIKAYFSSTASKADILDNDGRGALHHAARMNRVEVIEFMLKAGANVDVLDRQGLTPLHVAARTNSLEALDFLLRKGAKLNAISTSRGCTPLHIAVEFGNRQIVQRLLNEKSLEIDTKNGDEVTALHIAISRGYGGLCTDLLHSGASVKISTKEGNTCLHFAASAANTDTFSAVIQAALADMTNYLGYAMQSIRDVPEFGRFVNQTNGDKNTALHIAVQTGHVSICNTLFQYGADLNMQNRCYKTPLHLASIRKKKEIMESLIQLGAQLNIKDIKQRTPLHSAASSGNEDGIDLLLKSFAFRDPKDQDGMTPFLCAVAAGHTKCAELLLENGANISVRDKYQRCCFHFAVENDKEEVLATLLQRPECELINAPDIHERTPLHCAASSSNIRLLDILLGRKANSLLTNGAGKTALHIAAETGRVRHVEALVKNSCASVEQKDPDGRTPLHFAALNGNEKICAALLRMGAQVDSVDFNGFTPLLLAAKTGIISLIQLFLERNADINHQDKTGSTALLIASTRGHVEVVRMLLNRQASLKPNQNGLNCLDVAIENQQSDVVMVIIKNSRWREVLSAKGSDGQNRMGKLIQRFPDSAKCVLDRCIQSSTINRSITYDFSLLDPGPDDSSGPGGKPFFGLEVMVEYKQTDLLVHDISRKLLQKKWRVYGWFVYWTNLVLFSIFLGLMTYFMLHERGNVVLKPQSSYDENEREQVFQRKDINVFRNLLEFLILIFASLHLLKELYQIYVQRLEYFKQVTNLLEWVLYLSTIIFILPYIFENLSSLRSYPNLTWQLGTVAVFLAYVNLILFVQTLDYIGIYVTMFFQVATTVGKAISIFALFSFAFSVVFFILFREQESFKNFSLTLMKVVVMTIGELDYTAMIVDNFNVTTDSGAPLVPYRQASFIFLTLFIFAIPIVLMNLLVGLAVGDIESVQRFAYLRNKGKFVDFVYGVERRFPKFITRYFYNPQLVICGSLLEKKISSQEYTFVIDQDLDEDEDYMTAQQVEEQRLEVLTKELAKTTQRQLSIIGTIQDQRNLLLALAAKAGIDTREQDTRSVSRL